MDEPLVDSEGFPRNDIDINQVRLARNRIICKLSVYRKLLINCYHLISLFSGLQNDIRGIMKQIEEKLGEYFDKPE